MLSLQAENFTAPRPDQTETFQISYDYSVHGYNGPIQSGYSAYIYDSVKSWVPTWEVSKPALLQHSPPPRVWLTSLSLLFIPFPLAVSLPSVARIPADRWAWREESSVSITPITINPANQSRSDSKTGYLDGLPPRSNLVILTGYQATAVTFNGTKDANGSAIASGMDFMATADGSAGRKFSVLARKEVILS
jgi:choline dehydrogenase